MLRLGRSKAPSVQREPVQVLARLFPGAHLTGATIQGQRPHQEDRVFIDQINTRNGPRMVAAVFDGVGGQHNGAQAAQAAARRLRAAVAGHVVDGFLLQDLDHHVRATGGACTATIALLDDRITLLGVGDSNAYDARGRALLPVDRDGNGRLTAWLGGRPDGHLVRLNWEDAPLALCTDGVDRILGKLRPDGSPGWVARQLEAVLDGGAPDNATLVQIQPV